MSEKDCFTLNSIAPDVLRKIAGRLYVLADAIEAGTARYLQGAMWIDTKATSFEGPTADGRLRQLAGIERHGFPQGTVTIRSDIEFLTGQPVPPNARSKRRRHQDFHSAQKRRAGVRLTELLGGRHPACNPMGR